MFLDAAFAADHLERFVGAGMRPGVHDFHRWVIDEALSPKAATARESMCEVLVNYVRYRVYGAISSGVRVEPHILDLIHRLRQFIDAEGVASHQGVAEHVDTLTSCAILADARM